jgi:hypothetical protein
MGEVAVPVVCVSGTNRIQKLIETGQRSFNPYMNDAQCSRLVTLRYESLSDVGGPSGLRRMLEGPTSDGYHYRVEGADEPVLLFRFDESTERLRVFAATDPSRYLRFDPRETIVDEDHEVTFDTHEDAVKPGAVRMIVIEELGLIEDVDPVNFAGVQFFVTENDAARTADRLKLNLIPSMRSVGGERLWVLVHEETGYALGRGEARRLHEFYEQAIVDMTRRAANTVHDRVAGSFAEDARSSTKRPRKPGEGRTQIMGGTRFHMGKNQNRKPNKDVSQALQNKRNANSPGAGRARVRGLKKWHRSRDGQSFHRDLNRLNKQNNEAEERDEALRAKLMDVRDRINAKKPVGIFEADADMSSPVATGPNGMENPTPDDFLDAVIRRLIVTQNMDVLQDVEFDDETGAIYLFFDPVLMPDEVYEVMAAIRQERGDFQLIASPDMSLPGEAVESDWWVFYLPGQGDSTPDPMIYSRDPDKQGTKIQAVVMAPPNTPEAVANGLDVGALMQSAGS